MAEKKNTPIEETNGAPDEPDQADASSPDEAAPLSEEDREQMAAEAEEIAEAFAEAQQEMRRALGELRAELSQMQLEEARTRVTRWIDDNPTLAVLLAVGGGILVGRLLYGAFKPAPPPPLPERVQLRSTRIAQQAQDLVEEIGEALRERAGETGDVLRQKATRAGEEAVKRAQVWGEQVEEAAGDVTENVRERAERGFSLAESAWNATRTALAAVAVQRVADWARRLR